MQKTDCPCYCRQNKPKIQPTKMWSRRYNNHTCIILYALNQSKYALAAAYLRKTCTLSEINQNAKKKVGLKCSTRGSSDLLVANEPAAMHFPTRHVWQEALTKSLGEQALGSKPQYSATYLNYCTPPELAVWTYSTFCAVLSDPCLILDNALYHIIYWFQGNLKNTNNNHLK